MSARHVYERHKEWNVKEAEKRYRGVGYSKFLVIYNDRYKQSENERREKDQNAVRAKPWQRRDVRDGKNIADHMDAGGLFGYSRVKFPNAEQRERQCRRL
jgi:hypothetical protein